MPGIMEECARLKSRNCGPFAIDSAVRLTGDSAVTDSTPAPEPDPVVEPVCCIPSLLLALGALFTAHPLAAAEPVPSPAPVFDPAPYRDAVARIVQAATNNPAGFERLARFCDTFGPRFSGTTNLEAALDWALAQMRRDGLENVRSEEVLVPRWVRGAESVELLEPHPRPLHALALGGSVGTPPDGLTAEVLCVRTFDELQRRAAEARGRIVLFNYAFTGYGSGLPYRTRGAVEAARVGARASLIRSVTGFSLQSPHTGMMRYEDGVPRIPHVALALEDAALVQRWADRGERVVLRLRLASATLPDTPSRNLLAEWRGRQRPDEFVVVGGHSDSWDVAPGAMDDAGGCFAAWEAVRLLQRLDLRPRRTVRLVWWVNEENGLRGARTYRTNHTAELDRHVLAVESDIGVFQPTGFSFGGTPAARAQAAAIARLLTDTGATEVTEGGGGADTSPLLAAGVPVMELLTKADRYFWYHHTAADTVDKLDPAEFDRCVAALAALVYIVADLPAALPR
jgi:carboxypeptidase Q